MTGVRHLGCDYVDRGNGVVQNRNLKLPGAESVGRLTRRRIRTPQGRAALEKVDTKYTLHRWRTYRHLIPLSYG